MAVQSANGRAATSSNIPYTDLCFDTSDQEPSALRLVYWIRPKWREDGVNLQITKFTDGITNTLLKITVGLPDENPADNDRDTILLRAYGNGTELIIDREREATSHGLLARMGMAPPLLGRFKNGLLYGFIPGKVCKAEDLTREPIWRGVAQKLAEWHALVPISAITESERVADGISQVKGGSHRSCGGVESLQVKSVSSRRPIPNVWSVIQNWINALEVTDEKQQAQKELLQQEMDRSFAELDNEDGLGEHGFVFAHCDLLCANVIQLQHDGPEAPRESHSHVQPVTFIDYEYATPAPAAFDIANHFAEFAGYDCDYSRVPGQRIRRGFIEEYVTMYERYSGRKLDHDASAKLFAEVDKWRGIPGLYWGIWSLIQARISQIDFDYTQYAQERLGEYFAWRGEHDGTRIRVGRELPLREKTWMSE